MSESFLFYFSSRRRHTRWPRDWSSDVCSSDLAAATLQLTAQVRDHVDGLGPLQALTGPGVTDLLVNEDGSVWVDDADGLHRAQVRLGRAQARGLAVRLATSAGRRLADAVPWADAHLPSGIRFHAVLPPLSTGGAILSLRLPGGPELDLDALERLGSLTAEVREVRSEEHTSELQS